MAVRLTFLSALIFGFALVFACGFSAPAHAQNYDRIAPKSLPPASSVPEITPPPLSKSEGESKRVILKKLKGIKLIDSAAKLKRDGIHGSGVTVDGLPLLESSTLLTSLDAFLGKPLSVDTLQSIAQTIVAWYRENNRPFVDVIYPEQDIDSGTVQMVVTEFRVGKIDVSGNQWFSDDMLRSEVRLATGDPIDTARLQEDLVWLNQNPFRRVNIVANKSKTLGATDLELKTEDQFPVRVYAGYDNTGTPVLGRDRWSLGFNWGNALWLDQQFSYQFTSSEPIWDSIGGSRNPNYQAHSVNYLVPLPWRDKVTIFGSYAESRPELGPFLGLEGASGQASIRYIHALPGLAQLTHELQLGYDFKTNNNNLEFGGFQISNSTTEINQFLAVYAATLTDRYGFTTAENTFVYSPGGITDQNNDKAFQLQTGMPFTKASYTYDRIALNRTTRLPYDMGWVIRFTGQIADTNLLPSEQLGAGGNDSVRGYDEHVASGSKGLLLSQELRSPVFNLSQQIFKQTGVSDQTQLLAFWDYGHVGEEQTLTGPTDMELESVGLGIRASVSRYIDFRFDYGWQLRKPPGATSEGEMAQVAITLSY